MLVDLRTGDTKRLAWGTCSTDCNRHALASLADGGWALVASATSYNLSAVVVFDVVNGQAVTRRYGELSGQLMLDSFRWAGSFDEGVGFVRADSSAGWLSTGVRFDEMSTGSNPVGWYF